MLRDRKVMNAITNIRRRAEGHHDEEKINYTFVDLGIIDELDNENDQILYGRRGSGKTHVFKVLQSRINSNSNSCAIYLDAQKFGSSAEYPDTNLSTEKRCLSLFRDFLSEIYNGLDAYIVEYAPGDADSAFDHLEEFASAIIEPVETTIEKTITDASVDKAGKKSDKKIGFEAPFKARVEAGISRDQYSEYERSESYKVITEDKIVFPKISIFLSEILKAGNFTLYILLDEWSSLHLELQPYLAEYIKRSILPCQRVVLKIASIEYRSLFMQTHFGNRIGFELGADIYTTPGLDDYYVFDIDPDRLISIYSDILFRHINSELPFDYLKQHFHISDSTKFINHLFQGGAISELSRASEGIIRDLINIFARAFRLVSRPRFPDEEGKISRRIILKAAMQYFNFDKYNFFDDDMLNVCANIEYVVMTKNRSRFFLIPLRARPPEMLQKLLDARVIHVVHRNYSIQDVPGLRFNAYALDYGFYASIIAPARETTRKLAAGRKDAGIVKPFYEEQDLKRLIVDEKIFDKSIRLYANY